MNPPGEPHIRIGMNVYDALARQLRRPCRAYMGGGVWLSEDDHTWREPDIFVLCGQGEGFTRAPRLVVEVLSPSTEKEDRTRKLDFYRRFLSLEAVLLVWQDNRRIEARERDGERWVLRDVIGNRSVRLETSGSSSAWTRPTRTDPAKPPPPPPAARSGSRSPAATASLGATHEPPTQATFLKAR